MEVSVHPWSLGYTLIGSEKGKINSIELGTDIDECYRNFYNRWSKPTNWKYEIKSRQDFRLVELVIQSMESGYIDPSLKIEFFPHALGTPIRYKVWEAILNTRPGETISYKEIGKKINYPNAVRAIGSACGSNPIAVLIPCHRVVKHNGERGNYRWGVDLKNRLLDREQTAIS